MKLDLKSGGLLLIAAGLVVAGAYALLAERGQRSARSDAAPRQAPSRAAALPAQAPLPPSHPPVAVSRPPAGASAREGKVQVDAARPFTHFRVGNLSVRVVHADGKVMWLGTSGGLVRYDTLTQEFKTYGAGNGLTSNAIVHLGRLRGTVAVGTLGGGLSLFDRDTRRWKHYSASEGLGDAFVYDVLEAADGAIWIATGSGVNRVRGGNLQAREDWRLFNVENTGSGLPHDRVTALAQDTRGGVWCATAGGLARFHRGRWATWKRSPGADAAFDLGRISALKAGADGEVWLGSRGGGLGRFDGRTWTHYTAADGLPGNQVHALHFDRNGWLWIGTNAGLALFRHGAFKVLTTEHGLLAAGVHAITTTNDGGLWAGSFGGVAFIRQPAVN